MNKYQSNFLTLNSKPNQTDSLINSLSEQQQQKQYYLYDLPCN